MNIRCPHCQTVFRVNPERIPPAGVRAKCARCGDTFTVTPPAAQAAPGETQASSPRAVAATMPAPASPAQPAAGSSASATATGAPVSAGPQPAAAAPLSASPPPVGATQATPAAPPTQAPASPAGVPPSTPGAPAQVSGAPVFGARDPRARAERLARALVSDIVAYHPERRDRSLESGTLRTEFREEIMKSWEEYVAQVGLETAKSTPYFRDALNTILARGQKLF